MRGHRRRTFVVEIRMPAGGGPSAYGGDAVSDLLGIVVVSVPVTDLALSAAWYRDLLELDYVREFGDDEVTGCALADFPARYMIALRLRSATAAQADLRGEHPIILEARDATAADRVCDRATALGIAHSSGCHPDGTWVEFVDPDGICLRLVHDAAGPRTFVGVRTTPAGQMEFYDRPRLALRTTGDATPSSLSRQPTP